MGHAMLGAIGAAALASAAAAQGDQPLYSIDFFSPFHQVGQTATVDLGDAPRRGPSANRFQSPTVVADAGPLTDGALRFAAPSETSSLSQIKLGIESAFTGLDVDALAYEFSEDIVVGNINSSSDRFTIFFDSPRVNPISFLSGGVIRPDGVGTSIGRFTEGELLHLSLVFMTDQERWQINVNGVDLFFGPVPREASEGLREVRLSLTDRDERGSLVFVDNIVVRAIPAPSAAPLLLGLLIPRRRRRPARRSAG